MKNATKIIVELAHWINGQGWDYSSQIDTIEPRDGIDLQEEADAYAVDWDKSEPVDYANEDYEIRVIALDDDGDEIDRATAWMSAHATKKIYTVITDTFEIRTENGRVNGKRYEDLTAADIINACAGMDVTGKEIIRTENKDEARKAYDDAYVETKIINDSGVAAIMATVAILSEMDEDEDGELTPTGMEDWRAAPVVKRFRVEYIERDADQLAGRKPYGDTTDSEIVEADNAEEAVEVFRDMITDQLRGNGFDVNDDMVIRNEDGEVVGDVIIYGAKEIID